jgi:hypothetical protein
MADILDQLDDIETHAAESRKKMDSDIAAEQEMMINNIKNEFVKAVIYLHAKKDFSRLIHLHPTITALTKENRNKLLSDLKKHGYECKYSKQYSGYIYEWPEIVKKESEEYLHSAKHLY